MTAESRDPNYQGDGITKASAKSRPPVAAMEKGPGPAIYKLPQAVIHTQHSITKHRNPEHSFGIRHGKLTDDCSPGPRYAYHEALTRKGLQRSKSFTMSARNRPAVNLMKDTPGPGTNSPQIRFLSNKPKAQEWLIGKRSHFKLGDNNPAPNSYGMPEMIGTGIPNKASSACYSMHTRTKVGAPDEDLSKTPGPAAYGTTDNNIVYYQKPQWSMGARAKYMSALMNNPAPNQYMAKHCFADRKSAPGFSMGVKHSEYCMPLVIDCFD